MTPLFDVSRPPASIAVFRALQLGDMLCAVPALRALRRAFPQTRIVLIGLPNAGEFVKRFQAYVDELIEFPGIPAFPEQAPRPHELPAFFRRVRGLHAEVALQMHGSGRQSNPLVAQLGAQRWGGFVDEAAGEIPGCRMAWPDHLPEPRRYLALLRYLGIEAQDDALEFPVSRVDQDDAKLLLRKHALNPEKLILMHVGARLPSRRWPLERYAALARELVSLGWQVALTGMRGEKPLARSLQDLAGVPLTDLCGQTQLGSLAALLKLARLLVCNDTGVSHVAAGVGAMSVVIACGSDQRRWAPLDSARHVVLAADMPCRPCAFEKCPIGHPCALAVTVPDVLRQVQSQLRGAVQ